MSKFELKYPISCYIQIFLCKLGIAVHNPFRDECTPDFSCCMEDLPNGRHYWLKIDQYHLPIWRERRWEATAPIGAEGRTFKCIKKWHIGLKKRNKNVFSKR